MLGPLPTTAARSASVGTVGKHLFFDNVLNRCRGFARSPEKMVRCTETLLMRLFRVFIRAQSEFLFRCYSDPTFQSFQPARPTCARCRASWPHWPATVTRSTLRHSSIRNLTTPRWFRDAGGRGAAAADRATAACAAGRAAGRRRHRRAPAGSSPPSGGGSLGSIAHAKIQMRRLRRGKASLDVEFRPRD
jgi:hypothetical protein